MLPSLRNRELPGLAFVFVAIAWGAVVLFPEVRISQVPLNDGVLHLAASERLAQSFARGEPFLDPWVSEWALGYPMWRSYQPLPHLLAAAAMAIAKPFATAPAAFAFLQYLLLVLFPASVYAGARLLGMAPLAAGIASLLALAPSESGNYGAYGLGYGATTWRGSGLYTQIVALHFVVLTVGAMARALDTGRGRVVASILLALTGVSHIVFGYVAFVSAALLALVGPEGARARRVLRLAAIAVPAMVLLLWFVVPLARVSGEINHSRWESVFKWDSFGAPTVLASLLKGELLDADRFPSLTLLVLAGALLALSARENPVARRLLALALAWLMLFFGRETWGHLLLLVGVPRDFHIHRLEGAFELFAIMLAGFGIARAISTPRRPLAIAAAAALVAALVPIARERTRFLDFNRQWGDENLQAYRREHADLEAAIATTRAILAERPGRVSAGLAALWGRNFAIGSVPVYGFLSRAHIDHPSFLYHAMSRTSEVMVLRNDEDLAHHTALGIRVLIAPADRQFPALKKRAVHGRFAVYEASDEGFFGIVDLGGRYDGPPSTHYDLSSQWLQSQWLRHGVVCLLDARGPPLPSIGRWGPLPALPSLAPTGRVLSEEATPGRWRARYALARPAYAYLKVTWFPDLRATVDGVPAPVLRVTPGFAAVPVGAGNHEVVVEYRPGPLKPILFVLSILMFVACARALRRLDLHEARLVDWLERLGARLTSPPVATALTLAAISIVALHPLLRGKLMDGHDATAYLPRLVEMHRALEDLHIPPVWAPDLSNGHGQPLFEFAPPLVYLAAMPFYWLGAGIANSYQLGVFLLHLLGAIAILRLARRFTQSHVTAVGAAAAWLITPYVSLDLFVRIAFAEAAAVAVTPIALAALIAAMQHKSPRALLLAAMAVSLIPLAHFGSAVLVLPALALVVAATPGGRVTGALVLAGALGLSAFSWLPANLEKEFTKAHLLREDFLRWSEHVVAPWQLLYSRWGYGTSMPGTADDGMSFSLGPLHLALAVAGVILARRRPDRALFYAFAAIALGGAFFATDLAAPIWSHVETLQYLAYPWRTLALPALVLPLLAIPALDRLRMPRRLLVLGVLFAVNLPHTEPRAYLTYDEEYYAPQEIASRHLTTSTRYEYEPRTAEIRPDYRPLRLTGVEAPVQIVEQLLLSQHEYFATRSNVPTRVTAGMFAFPGWRVRVDGVEVPSAPAPSSGLVSFALPAGEHRVDIDLERTGPRSAGLWLSVATLLTLLGFAVAGALRARNVQ